ncbi:hypothetical protein HMN09_01415700 [Mycena chlorophos]|uniref:Uncharacterized protein n=1 Tax=Mycena chlorophos TaxID=658473 RepID=A0A8H6RX82_MYCCL|nr:hypothetical protein HMN09_01415700 [Mycena chlorophos]
MRLPRNRTAKADADPYARIFFSKDHREEVIEIEEEPGNRPKSLSLRGATELVKILPQGEWMKGSDMSDRSVLYFKLLEWLETISSHETLASLMGQPIGHRVGQVDGHAKIAQQ